MEEERSKTTCIFLQFQSKRKKYIIYSVINKHIIASNVMLQGKALWFPIYGFLLGIYVLGLRV
jgi:Na+-transporting NADH:ubiquinone oxidoreductase subunit NqrC